MTDPDPSDPDSTETDPSDLDSTETDTIETDSADQPSIRRYRPSTDADRVAEVFERALRDAGAYFEPGGAGDHEDAGEGEAHEDEGTGGDDEGTTGEDGGNDRGDPVVRECHAEGVFLVATADDRIVGTAGFRPRGDDGAELKRMHVDPSYQRRGVGSRLLETIESRARGAGYETMVLETSSRQTAAHAFYERHGYEEVGRERRGEWTVLTFRRSLLSGDP